MKAGLRLHSHVQSTMCGGRRLEGEEDEDPRGSSLFARCFIALIICPLGNSCSGMVARNTAGGSH